MPARDACDGAPDLSSVSSVLADPCSGRTSTSWSTRMSCCSHSPASCSWPQEPCCNGQRNRAPCSHPPRARPEIDRSSKRRRGGVATVGTVVGFITGFFGVGGGFVVVPGLVLALGFGMPEAVGTSLVVIALNSVVALAARGGVTALDWHVVIPFTAAAMAGSVVGGGLAARVPASALERSFAGLLVLVSVYTATKSILGLF